MLLHLRFEYADNLYLYAADKRRCCPPRGKGSNVSDGVKIVVCHPVISKMASIEVFLDVFDGVSIGRTLPGYTTVFCFSRDIFSTGDLNVDTHRCML